MKKKKLEPHDRDAIIILVAIILVCAVLFPYAGRWLSSSEERDASPDSGRVMKGKTGEMRGEGKSTGGYYAVEGETAELFSFDPNTADSTQLLRLGLRPWQVRNIYKYRAAGGRYRKPTDFARLYGLTLEQYKRLEPYIHIVPEVMAADVYGVAAERHYSDERVTRSDSPVVSRNSVVKPSSTVYQKKISMGEKIDINNADTATLKTIPGIGSYFARQIVYRREKLGGYVNTEQLCEIEGFPQQSLAYATVGSSPKVAKLYINELNEWKLSRHPYILYIQAKEIVKYRNEYGKIKSVEELTKLKTLDAQTIKKLAPYLDFK